MKLVIDTCNKDLYVALLENNNILASSLQKELVKKADALPFVFEDVLKTANAKVKDIKAIYVTKGPGSFMGARTGLIFAKTLALTLKLELFTASTFSFISQGKDGIYFIDAKGSLFYKSEWKNGSETLSLATSGFEKNYTYSDFEVNPQDTLKCFKLVNDILNEDSFYLKDPKVGGE